MNQVSINQTIIYVKSRVTKKKCLLLFVLLKYIVVQQTL